MSSPARKSRKASGISVYPRRGKWAFLVSTEPDILTGKRKRQYRMQHEVSPSDRRKVIRLAPYL